MRPYSQAELKDVLDNIHLGKEGLVRLMHERYRRTLSLASVGPLIRKARLQLYAVRGAVQGPIGVRKKDETCVMVRENMDEAIKVVQGDVSKYEFYRLVPLDVEYKTVLSVREKHETRIPATGTDIRSS